MNEQLSALMDGELDEAEVEAMLVRLRNSEDGRKHWGDFHLIGDALRGSASLDSGLTARVMEALADEPVILAPPRRNVSQSAPLMQRAFALAASVAGVAVVTALAWSGPERSGPMAEIAKLPADAQVPAQLASANLQAYLVAHQTHAPSSQGVAQYIKTVSVETGGR